MPIHSSYTHIKSILEAQGHRGFQGIIGDNLSLAAVNKSNHLSTANYTQKSMVAEHHKQAGNSNFIVNGTA
ncbi:hypothetical protein [Pseudoalteromonas ulvae]|uniref:hypothetical protein n=1 Tax=Pseudoalteromonas ulvae TaxID=107327 RepID=UPI00186BA156|nr:hypothetical protein [Pseudoalteromonas ulvae]